MNSITEKQQPININGKQVAVLRDGSLLDIRKHSNHFIFDGAAVCIANETLRQARQATIIQVTNIEKKIKYTISRLDFDTRSFEFKARGFEEQRACYLRYFASNEPKRTNYPVHIEAEPLQIEQMRLFS